MKVEFRDSQEYGPNLYIEGNISVQGVQTR